jgi:hypothetical protein
MAHPFWRGRLGGLLMIGVLGGNTFFALDGFCLQLDKRRIRLAMSCIRLEISSWVQLSFQVILPSLSLISCFFVPESPR